MSDVRLVGTNPDNGSLVPVSVTSAGLLRTAIGKIEKIPNDVEIEGDLTVTGTINGSSGGGGEPEGEYLPEPFGEDGTVLTIVDGAPAWATPASGPGPDPEPTGTVSYVDNSVKTGSGYGYYNCAGTKNGPASGQDAWAKSLECFGSQTRDQNLQVVSSGNVPESFVRFNLEDCFTKVLVLSLKGYFNFFGPTGTGNKGITLTVTTTADNITPIAPSVTETISATNYYNWAFEVSFLLNRESYTDAMFNAVASNNASSEPASSAISWTGWRLEDSGAYAIQQQIKAQERIDELQKALLQLKS